jgi:hypothetical protein
MFIQIMLRLKGGDIATEITTMQLAEVELLEEELREVNPNPQTEPQPQPENNPKPTPP